MRLSVTLYSFITCFFLLNACKQSPKNGVQKKSNDASFHYRQDTLMYASNTFSGRVFDQYENGDSLFLGTFLNGLEEGIHKKWYSHQNIQEIRVYHLGKKVGRHIGFWESGQMKFEYHFKNGEMEGTLKEWYVNGHPYRFFNYENGYEAGSQKMWWENGVIRANYVIKEGRKYGLIGLKLCANPNKNIQ